MKFQKTLLAVALAVSAASMGVSAAEETVQGEQLVYQYEKLVKGADDKLVASGNFVYEIGGKVYTRAGNDTDGYKYTEVEDSKASDLLNKEAYQFSRGGLVKSNSTVSTTTPGVKETSDVGASHAWNFAETVTTKTTGSTTTLDGKVTSDLKDDAIDASGVLTVLPGSETTQAKTFDLNVGQFEGSNGKNLGVVSTITETDAAAKTEVKYGTALNALGLTLAKPTDVSGKQVSIDYSTGTVTVTTPAKDGTTIDKTELVAFGTITTTGEGAAAVEKRDVQVIKFNGEYYKVGANGTDLTKADASAIDGLKTVAGGAATGQFDAETIKDSTTAFVGATKSVYGEKSEVFANANTIKVGSTDTLNVLQNGKEFTIGSNTPKSSTEKYVATGIIKTDADNNNTYGVNIVEIKDGKTQFTEVTAEGIKTTGDIAFVDAKGETTTVKGYLAETSKAVDAKIDAGLQQFNTTANRLNSRIDDVEKTSYRGIAIALAAQQQIPNIGAGQTAVFGGVGHYEGESAAALGLATVLADGRTSLSAALGVAGGSEVGGRVGVAYVFGGK